MVSAKHRKNKRNKTKRCVDIFLEFAKKALSRFLPKGNRSFYLYFYDCYSEPFFRDNTLFPVACLENFFGRGRGGGRHKLSSILL